MLHSGPLAVFRFSLPDMCCEAEDAADTSRGCALQRGLRHLLASPGVEGWLDQHGASPGRILEACVSASTVVANLNN